jgi:hypothetical protein
VKENVLDEDKLDEKDDDLKDDEKELDKNELDTRELDENKLDDVNEEGKARILLDDLIGQMKLGTISLEIVITVVVLSFVYVVADELLIKDPVNPVELIGNPHEVVIKTTLESPTGIIVVPVVQKADCVKFSQPVTKVVIVVGVGVVSEEVSGQIILGITAFEIVITAVVEKLVYVVEDKL